MRGKVHKLFRPKLVCLECRAKKLKCDKLRPTCTRCRKNSLYCVYGDSSRPDEEYSASEELKLGSNAQGADGLDTDSGKRSIKNGIASPSHGRLADRTINLCSPKNMLVVRGSTTFVDYPFSAHSITQHDPYARVLCGSLHGLTLIELSNHLRGHSKAVDPRVVSPLPYIEKAIVKHMEYARLKSTRLTFRPSGPRSLDDDNSVSELNRLFKEIEDALMDQRDCDSLLKAFYQEIYPFHPFMNVSLFEEILKAIFVVDVHNRLKITITGNDRRKKVEGLCIFLMAVSMALKRELLNSSQLLVTKVAASKTARLLSEFAVKLIDLLDIFNYTNEGGLTCALYYYVSQYLDPEAADVSPSHTQLLHLKNIAGMATTLGLQHEPSKYGRYRDLKIAATRRALWFGIQSLIFQVALAEGASDMLSSDQMEHFLRDMTAAENFPEITDCMSEQLKVELFEIATSKYKFHLELNKVMSACAPFTEDVQLGKILKNVEKSEHFMKSAFPIQIPEESPQIQLKSRLLAFERGATIDITNIKRTEMFLGNLVGRLCFLNLYDMLSLQFEKECADDWETNEIYYHQMAIKAFFTYLDLTDLISRYLSGQLGGICQQYGYAVNKQVSFAILRIWIFQCQYLLRLSFKHEIVFTQAQCDRDGDDLNPGVKNSDYESVLLNLRRHVRNQMVALIDLAESTIKDTYMSCFKTIPMFKYLAYVVDNNKLVLAANEFWQLVSEGNPIPQSIREEIALKWGLEPLKSKSILYHLTGPHALRCFDYNLIVHLESRSMKSYFERDPQRANGNSPPFSSTGMNETDTLNQILESSSEAFWTFLIDNSSRFPS
ncbi:LADA_0B11034g1_1 [Lachancea dasiensis]|uniref:LADA_0B11034g1_1 n=1 Tax=Lachancea dasiensis TaxID=1072105 RepID=A0A1G4IW00_9SACH|nr:LADA_0B11034g1_1 [Lachancea dasiensis]